MFLCKVSHRGWLNLIMSNYPLGLQSFISEGGYSYLLHQRHAIKISGQSPSLGVGTLKPKIIWTSSGQSTHRSSRDFLWCPHPGITWGAVYPSHALHHLLYTFLMCTTSLSRKVTVTLLPSISLNHSPQVTLCRQVLKKVWGWDVLFAKSDHNSGLPLYSSSCHHLLLHAWFFSLTSSYNLLFLGGFCLYFFSLQIAFWFIIPLTPSSQPCKCRSHCTFEGNEI